ncbi:MAG: hypothetical protein IJ573_01120 [Clostridia bacterium]|nr:hypothetical protein [Clostridia bacterium]
MRMRKAERFIPAAVLALVLLCFVTGIGSREKVWEDMTYTALRFSQGTHRSLADGDSYGEMNEGPGFVLPAGTYRVKWRVSSDGDNELRLSGLYGLNCDTQVITLPAGQETGEASFTLREATAGLELTFAFCSGTVMDVEELRLYSPAYRDGAFTFLFLAALGLLLWKEICSGRLTQPRRMRLCLVGLAVLIGSAPSFKDTVCLGHDSVFHLVRLMNLADGLTDGLPVRLGGFSYNGFGAITSVFYPDLFLTLPALLIHLGSSMQFAVNAYCIALNALSALTMYVCAKRLFEDEDAGAMAAVAYVLCVYRLSDVYTRFAVGEMTAMALLPLFLLGLWETLLGEKRRWPLLGLAASAIALSHVLSTVICAALAAVCCLLTLRRLFVEKRFISVLKALTLAALLCAFWLVPFAHFAGRGIGGMSLFKDPAYFVLHPAQLLLQGEGELAVDPADPALATFSLELGLPLLLGAALTFGLQGKKGEDRRHSRLALALTLLGIALALCSTALFPWPYMRKLTGGLSDALQFPWRLLMPASALLCLCCGWAYRRFAPEHPERMTAALLALCALSVLPMLSRETRSNRYIPFGEGISPDLAYTEYTLPGTVPEETRNAALRTEGGAQVKDVQKQGSRITARVMAEQDAALILPLYGYDGYRAKLTESRTALSVSCTEDRRLRVALPAGTDGTLCVWYAGLPAWRIADAISLVTLAAAAALWLKQKKEKNKRKTDENQAY